MPGTRDADREREKKAAQRSRWSAERWARHNFESKQSKALHRFLEDRRHPDSARRMWRRFAELGNDVPTKFPKLEALKQAVADTWQRTRGEALAVAEPELPVYDYDRDYDPELDDAVLSTRIRAKRPLLHRISCKRVRQTGKGHEKKVLIVPWSRKQQEQMARARKGRGTRK